VTNMSDAFESMARNFDAAERAEAERIDAERRAECQQLRSLTLMPADRDAVPPVDDPPRWPIERRLPAKQLAALAKLDDERRPVHAKDDIVIVARGTETAPRIFMVRIRTSSPGDSGWYVGPVGFESTSDDCVALSIESLLGERKDLAQILAMPHGYLIVENSDGIEYLCNESDEPVPLIVDEDDANTGPGPDGGSA
jgi:hypothetical protein